MTNSTIKSIDIQAFDTTEPNTEQYTENTEQNQIAQDCSVSCSESEIQSTQSIQQIPNKLDDKDKGGGYP